MQHQAEQTANISASITIFNRVDELGRVAIWLKQVAERLHLPEHTVFKLDLVLNEALPNIISYAFRDQSSHAIDIRIEDFSDFVVLEIVDDGAAFNPFALDTFMKSLSLEAAAIGGRGIHLIKSFSDRQEYRRNGNTNMIRISFLKSPEKKKLAPVAPA